MTKNKLFSCIVALAMALPFAAVAADAPGVFKVPGTESTLKIYGFARTDISYDLNQANGWPTDIFNVKLSSLADGTAVPSGDPQFAAFTAKYSRIGFTTTTPSAAGAIGVKVEGDFGNNFRLRHGYGTIGDFLLIGQTWSTFTDLGAIAGADTVDWDGVMTSQAERYQMIRATFNLGGASLALAAEAPHNPLGGPKQIPDFVVAVNVPMSWGHLNVRGAVEPLKTGGANQLSGMGYAAAVGGHVEFGGDSLLFEVMAGSGADAYLDTLGNIGVSAVVVNGSITGYQTVSYGLGYTHVWTPAVRSNLILTGAILKNNKDTRDALSAAAAQNVIQVFGNVFYSVAKNAELGLEYTWGQKTDFFNNKYVLSRINAVATFTFF